VTRAMLRAALMPAILLALAPLAGAAQQGKALDGRWELRERPTAEPVPDTALQELPPAPMAGRPQRDGASGSPPGGRPRGGRRISDEDRRQLNRLFGMAGEVPAFEINVVDTAVTITNQDGFSYVLVPDGQGRDFQLDDSTHLEVKAQWKRGDLVVEWKPDGGGKMTETYSLADSGVFLRLEVTIEHDRLSQKIWRTRMYRRADGSEP